MPKSIRRAPIVVPRSSSSCRPQSGPYYSRIISADGIDDCLFLEERDVLVKEIAGRHLYAFMAVGAEERTASSSECRWTGLRRRGRQRA
jgi:hypothetical protein